MTSLATKIIAATMVGALALLSGSCSSDNESTDSSPASSSENYPISLPGPYGNVEIAKRPERIIALNSATADELLSLGITPVAVAGTQETVDRTAPWLSERLKEILDSNILNPGGVEINYEHLASLDADLLVGQNLYFPNVESFEKTNAIVPTVLPESEDRNVDWETRYLTTARAVGKESEAKSEIGKIKSDFEDFGRDPELSEKTYNYISVQKEKGTFSYGNGRLLELTGLVPATNQEDSQNKSVITSSLENIADLDGDIIFDWESTTKRQEVEKIPGFDSLPATKAGNVFYLQSDIATALNNPGPQGVNAFLDFLKSLDFKK